MSVATVSPRGSAAWKEELLSQRRHRRRRDRIVVWMLRLLMTVLFLAAWWLISHFEVVNPLFVSNPFSVGDYLVEALIEGTLWVDIWATMSTALAGLLAGSIAGILTGIVLFELPRLRRAVQPLLTLANALPRPALAPIFLLWFGLGPGSKIAVSLSIVYFVLLLNTLAGLSNVAPDQTMLARTLGMSKTQRFRWVQLPAAGPAIVAGLRLSAVYSVLGVVVAEMVASVNGLGVALVAATNRFEIAGSFAILFILACIAFLLDAAVGQLEQRMAWERND